MFDLDLERGERIGQPEMGIRRKFPKRRPIPNESRM